MKKGAAAATAGALLLLLVMTKKSSPPPETVPTVHIGKRAQVVREAKAALTNPPTPDDVWYDVAPSLVGTRAAWCGGFALWVLHRVGLALGVNWEIGKGFAYQLPTTRAPEPGDIAYFDQPYQHHAIVVARSGDLVTTVDGNQPGVAMRLRDIGEATAYFSIGPFLEGGKLA